MGQPKGCQVRHCRVEIAVGDPDSLQIEYSFDGHLRDCGYCFRPGPDRSVEGNAEFVGNETGLHRADPLHVRMVGEEVRQPIRVQFQVMAHELGLELAPVLRMIDPVAVQLDRLASKHLNEPVG